MKLKAYFSRCLAALPKLKGLTASVLGGTLGVLLPCAALMAVVYILDTVGEPLLVGLFTSLIVTPVVAGVMTYAAGASWEGRRATLMDAYHLARIRIKEILMTGLAAGVVVWIASLLTSLIYSLIGIIPALLGWIPVVGPVVTAVISVVFWLIMLAVEFAAHTILTAGMLPLTVDGITGRAQAERAQGILRGAGERAAQELTLVFLMWVPVQAIYELAAWRLPTPGALVFDLLRAALAVVSMIAISVIYLKARDERDGMRYHA